MHRRGAFLPFVHPALAAPDAPVSWLAQALTSGGAFYATPMSTGDIDGFTPNTYPQTAHILLGAKGEEHVIVRANGVSTTLTLRGARSAIAPVIVTMPVDLHNPEKMVERLRRLAAHQSVRALKRRDRDRKPERRLRLLRDALAAIDGHDNGATYREIAAVLYGRGSARIAWSSSSRALKDHIRYALRRGEALRGGGYLTLLSTGV